MYPHQPYSASSHRYAPSLPVTAIGDLHKISCQRGGVPEKLLSMWMKRGVSGCLQHHWFGELRSMMVGAEGFKVQG